MKSFRRGDVFLKLSKNGQLFQAELEIHKQLFEFSGTKDEIFSKTLCLSKSIADFVLDCMRKFDTL
jgi:hypothetical protein